MTDFRRFVARLTRARFLLTLPMFSLPLATACRKSEAARPTWVSDGAELGRKVRGGALPSLHHHQFYSTYLATEVGLVVLTPPGYRREAARRYPVIYVFPGIGGNEWTYLRALGHDSAMLHTVFSKPELAPIVVFANPGDSGAYGAAEKALAEELVAHVDRTYPTRAEARARSLEGFSLGGVTALTLLTRHPDVFGAAVASSSACYLIARCNRLRAQLRSSPRASNPRVLLSVGAKEGRENRAVSEELARRFGTRVFELAGVGHDWAAQNGAQVDDRAFGQLVGEFHLGRFGS